MRIYDQLDEMKSLIAQGDWDGIEKAAKKRCEKLAGKEIATEIAEISLTEYSDELEEALKRAYEEAEEAEAPAVYFEYDMDNEWNGALYVCPEYAPEDEEDDDWATNSDSELEAPNKPEFAEIYREDFDEDDIDRGVNGYLIARTVAAFGRCVDSLPEPDFAVCVGFLDQDGIFRIREGEGFVNDEEDFDDEDEMDDEE